MPINISNLNPLSNISYNSGSSQNSDTLIPDPNSALASSLLGNSEQNTNDNSLLFTPILNISNTAQMLSKRQESLSKTLVKISDQIALIHAARLGVNQLSPLLNSLKSLLNQAESSTLSSEQRILISQNIKNTLENYKRIIENTQYSGNKILSEERSNTFAFPDLEVGNPVQIHLPDLSAEKLGLDQLDSSSVESSIRSLNILNQAFFTVQESSDSLENTYSQLNDSSESLQKKLLGILKFESSNTNTLNKLIQNLQSSDLSQTQNTKLLSNIASSLLE